jgi:hypothetical protein
LLDLPNIENNEWTDHPLHYIDTAGCNFHEEKDDEVILLHMFSLFFCFAYFSFFLCRSPHETWAKLDLLCLWWRPSSMLE